MTGDELVKLLAGRINQPHVIRTYFQKVADHFYKKGQEEALKNSRLDGVSDCCEAKAEPLHVCEKCANWCNVK